MNHKEIIVQLQSQSTWFLFFINVFTLGIYCGHYIIRQTRVINSHVGHHQPISFVFVLLIVVLKYAFVLGFVLNYFYPAIKGLFLTHVLLDLFIHASVIVWGVQARNRMNRILNVTSSHFSYFGLLGSVMFSPFYLNYKVNMSHEKLIEQYAVGA